MPYQTMSAVPPSLRGIDPPITLAQANQIAAMADAIEGVESSWAVAIANFKKGHTVKDGAWVKKEASTAKEMSLSLSTVDLLALPDMLREGGLGSGHFGHTGGEGGTGNRGGSTSR